MYYRVHYQFITKSRLLLLLENQPRFFKEKHDFVWAFCRYFWECHVCFDNISINELEIINEAVKYIIFIIKKLI